MLDLAPDGVCVCDGSIGGGRSVQTRRTREVVEVAIGRRGGTRTETMSSSYSPRARQFSFFLFLLFLLLLFLMWRRALSTSRRQLVSPRVDSGIHPRCPHHVFLLLSSLWLRFKLITLSTIRLEARFLPLLLRLLVVLMTYLRSHKHIP